MQADETLAHQRIQDVFKRLSQATSAYGGVAHEIRGDALVAEFARASDAVCAALKFQADNREHNAGITDNIRPEIRVGISLGEVVVADGTVTGAGVILAQRLEQLAAAGEVVVQGSVFETVLKRLPFEFEGLGEQPLKGFDDPIRAFATRLKDGQVVPAPDSTPETGENEVHADDSHAEHLRQISLVVLPFSTIGRSNDTEDIADGITDILINTLSRTGMGEIADRASTFSYKGQTPRPTEVSEMLGFQYVLQGTVQQAGSRVRVTAELFDAEANRHVWSERYSRTVEDAFEFQDDIAKHITQSIRTLIVVGADWESETDNFDAWLRNVQCVEHYLKGSAENNRQARHLAEQVMNLDPKFLNAPYNMGLVHWYDSLYGWSNSSGSSADESFVLAQVMFDSYDEVEFRWKYSFLGINLVLRGEYDQSVELAEKQLELLPDDGGNMSYTGWIYCLSGDQQRAQIELNRGLQQISRPWWQFLETLGLSLPDKWLPSKGTFGPQPGMYTGG